MRKGKDMPSFEVGDKVSYHGQEVTIATVGQHDRYWLKDHEQLYGVRLAGWTPTASGGSHVYTCPVTGDVRDHEFDTIGCVPESELTTLLDGSA